MIDKSCEDTSLFRFRVWVFAGYMTISIELSIFLTVNPASMEWESRLTLNERLYHYS